MSALIILRNADMPAYVRAKYQADNADIHPIRLSPQVYAFATSSEPTGGTTTSIHAKQSKSDREFGVRARFLRVARTVGTAPNTFIQYANLPVLTLAAFESATYADGQTLSYKGTTWEIVSHTKESKK
jgi:hypothetical protein